MTADRNQQSEQRSPYWAVGLTLLGVVVLILAAAFVLNQRLQPQVGIVPLASTPTRGSSTPAPHSAVTLATPRATVAPSPTAIATASPTPVLSPRQQVVQAYHRYWQAYSRALYTLNTSHMDTVAVDAELRRVAVEVAGFRQRGYAVHVRVTHHALIVSIKGNTATIYDDVLNRSYAVDPVTKKPGRGSSQADREKNIYFLRKIQGVWKVTEVLRQKG